jgi:hypothetical protein
MVTPSFCRALGTARRSCRLPSCLFMTTPRHCGPQAPTVKLNFRPLWMRDRVRMRRVEAHSAGGYWARIRNSPPVRQPDSTPEPTLTRYER